MRSHRADLALVADTLNLVHALAKRLQEREVNSGRRGRIACYARAARPVACARTEPTTKELISQILGDALDQSAIVFNEYWAHARTLRRRMPGTYFGLSPAGDLGWALPAALGAKRAAPGRTVVATLGDGAYLLANPAACHHASQRHDLPVLTVIANNGRWHAVYEEATTALYPDSVAARGEERRPDSRPSRTSRSTSRPLVAMASASSAVGT